jgi:hypothetical protein
MTLAALVSMVVALVVCGVAVYLIDTYLPLSPPFKIAIRVLVILALVVYLLRVVALI